MTVQLYTSDFSSGWNQSGWSSTTTSATPSVSNNNDFLGRFQNTTVSLTLGDVSEQRVYAVDVSAKLYLMGDSNPGNDGVLYYTGEGGPAFNIKVSGTNVASADFYNEWQAVPEYGQSNDPSIAPDGGSSWLGYDYEGNEWQTQSPEPYCITREMDAVYSVHFRVPVLDKSSIKIEFTATGSGSNSYWGLDDVTVNAYTYGQCPTCSGEADGKVSVNQPSVSFKDLSIKPLGQDGIDIGPDGKMIGVPRLYWIGPDGGAGVNWTSEDDHWKGTPIVAVYDMHGGPEWFDTNTSGSSFSPRHGYKGQLAHDSSGGFMILTDLDGNRTFFQDENGTEPGRFVKYVNTSGNTYEANGTSGTITSITQTVGGDQSLEWSFNGSGQATQAEVKENGATIRSNSFTYYDGAEDYGGNAGDLKFATESVGGTVVRTHYYRTWKSTDSGFGAANAWEGAPKFYFSPTAYERLYAAHGDVTQLDDSTVAPYADIYYKAFDTNRHVIEQVNAGEGDLLISRTIRSTSGTNDAGYNEWRYKNETTYPDGTKNIAYLNAYGQTMLEVFKDASGNARPVIFHKYGESSHNRGQVVMTAHPSAFTLVSGKYYDDTYADLLQAVSGNYTYLANSKGLVETNEYYDATGSTGTNGASGTNAGGVLGYFKQSSVQRGETGTPIRQNKTLYFSHTSGSSAGSITIYPVAKEITYAGTGLAADGEYGTDPRTTNFQYYFVGDSTSGTIADDTNQVIWTKTILPAITIANNGPASSATDTGSADTTTQYFDSRSRLTWSMDGNGSISYRAYDDASDAVIKSIVDVSYASLSGGEQTSYQATGWSTNHAGLHLVTTMEVDAQGRTTKVTDPNGNITHTVYKDADHEVRTYRGFDGTNTTGPIQISRQDSSGIYSEVLTLATTPNLTSGKPDGTESITAGNIRSLSRTFVNASGQTTKDERYFNLSGLTYSTGSNLGGTAGTHFYQTQYAYDSMGRQNRVVNPLSTITRTVFDAMGRVSSTWIGTDDTPSSGTWTPTNTAGTDLTKVQEQLYDTYDPATAGIGDGNVTRITSFPSGTNDARVTELFFDWRNRQVAGKSGQKLDGSGFADNSNEATNVQRVIFYNTFNNLGEVTQSDQYDGDGLAMTGTNHAVIDANDDGVPDAPSSSYRRARSSSDYDEQGRVWRSQVFSVNQSNGTVSSNSLKTWNWYDHRGSLIKTLQNGGSTIKYMYDGANRQTKQFITDGGGDAVPGTNGAWWNAIDVVGDNVLQQNESQYDSNGNAIFSTTKLHFHDDTNTGELANISGTPKARVSFQSFYYDKADRLTDSVDVGTYAGSTYTRPGSAPTNRSNTLLLTHYDYNDAGQLETVTDPKGIASKTYYDLLSRTTKTIANYVNGTPSDADDQTTLYTYDGMDHVLTMTADMPAGTNDQVTQYVYGITSGGGSGLTSNDLLKEIRYPDKTTGSASTNAANIEAFTYNALGEPKTLTDRNNNIHAYSYDVLGRLNVDNVTQLGSGVVGTMRRMDYSYDTAGRSYQMTSYGNTNGTGTPLNQIQREYNGYGQLITEYQAHGGAVNTYSSPKVQYMYSEGGSGVSDNHSRLNKIVYPNGRVLRYEYGTSGGLNDKISRLAYLSDQTPTGAIGIHLEEYAYLGLSTVVDKSRPESATELTYIKQSSDTITGDAGDNYTGLDRFGRIVDQRWIKTNGTNVTHTDRFQYGYDANSNPLYKDNKVSSTFSELYHANGTNSGYDSLNRLTDFRRGTLSDSNSDNIPDTVSTLNTLTGSQKNWSLDALGNWNSSTTDGNTVNRTHDAQNELTTLGSDTLVYDNAGDIITDQNGDTLTYDAWNRLIEDDNGSLPVTYAYDALGRRIQRHQEDTLSSYLTTDYFFSAQEQVLEERDDGYDSGSESDIDSMSQYVWSPTYVNELVLRDRQAGYDQSGIVRWNTSIGGGVGGIAVDSSGRTLQVGEVNSDFAVDRIRSNGNYDASFDTDGRVRTDLNSNSTDSATSVAIAPDGKLVVAGTSDGDYALVRYNANGSLDSNFNSSGIVIRDGGGSDMYVAVGVNDDGSIIAVSSDFKIDYYDSSGTYQSTATPDFGTGATESPSARAMAPLSGGGFIIVGTLYTDTSITDVALASVSSTGSASWAYHYDNSGLLDYGEAVTVLDNGSLLVAGSTQNNVDTSSMLYLLNIGSNGTSQSTASWQETDEFNTYGAQGYGIAQQSGSQILVSVTSALSGEMLQRWDMSTWTLGDTWTSVPIGPLVMDGPYRVNIPNLTQVGLDLQDRIYVQQDANYNVTSIADAGGTPLARYVEDAYGKRTILSANWATTSDAYDWVYSFQGGREDKVTGRIQFQRRDYDVNLGRWIEQDSVIDGMNRYQFVLSSPLAAADPLGLQTRPTTTSTTRPTVPVNRNNSWIPDQTYDLVIITDQNVRDAGKSGGRDYWQEFVNKNRGDTKVITSRSLNDFKDKSGSSERGIANAIVDRSKELAAPGKQIPVRVLIIGHGTPANQGGAIIKTQSGESILPDPPGGFRDNDDVVKDLRATAWSSTRGLIAELTIMACEFGTNDGEALLTVLQKELQIQKILAPKRPGNVYPIGAFVGMDLQEMKKNEIKQTNLGDFVLTMDGSVTKAK